MFCTSCDHDKELKGRKIKRKYDISGLDNIVLDGVIEYRCPKCTEVYFSYGNILQLNKLIAHILLTKNGLLTGKEIRFLRTNIGYNGAYFAKVLGIDHTYLSRIENGKVKHSPSLDKHVREAVFNKTADRNYDLHDAILNQPTKVEKNKNIGFRSKDSSWVPTIELSPLLDGCFA